MGGLELPYLTVGSPTGIAVTRPAEIHFGNVLQTARRIESRCCLASESLSLNEAGGPGRSNGESVQTFRLGNRPLHTSQFSAHERGAALEILRTMLCPGM